MNFTYTPAPPGDTLGLSTNGMDLCYLAPDWIKPRMEWLDANCEKGTYRFDAKRGFHFEKEGDLILFKVMFPT